VGKTIQVTSGQVNAARVWIERAWSIDAELISAHNGTLKVESNPTCRARLRITSHRTPKTHPDTTHSRTTRPTT